MGVDWAGTEPYKHLYKVCCSCSLTSSFLWGSVIFFRATARLQQNISCSSCLGSGFSIIWSNFSSTLLYFIFLGHLQGVTCRGSGVCTLLFDDECEDWGVPTEDSLSSISLCSCSCAWPLPSSLSSSHFSSLSLLMLEAILQQINGHLTTFDDFLWLVQFSYVYFHTFKSYTCLYIVLSLVICIN